MKAVKLLQRCLASSKIARVTRVFADNLSCTGIVVYINEDIIAMREFYDFAPNGYSVFRTRDITSARSGKNERFCEHVLKSEGLLTPEVPEWKSFAPARDMREALMQRKGEAVILECESPDENERPSEFYLGRIISVGKKNVRLEEIDALGKREDRPTKISLEAITMLQLESRYLQIFEKYAQT